MISFTISYEIRPTRGIKTTNIIAMSKEEAITKFKRKDESNRYNIISVDVWA